MLAVMEEEVLAFGPFTLWPRARVLRADGVPVELGGRAFDLLLALARGNGALLSKDALMEVAWPGLAVEENNLHVQIGAIRRALGAAREAVITVPGRGYRFGLALRAAGREAAEAPPAEASLSLMVLPFLAIGGVAATEALAEGVTDSLTTDLSRALPGNTVLSRTSAQAFRARGDAQPVRYLLEGSIASEGGRVRVNAQLIAAATDMHVWAERFDQPREHDSLRAQDMIVARLTRLVALHVILAEAHRTGFDAQALWMRAQSAALASRMSAAGVTEARDLYTRALALDPGNIHAAAGLASVHAFAVVNGHAAPAEREVLLAEAARLAELVLRAHPGHLCALQVRAVVLRAQGRFADAIAAASAVLARCPGDPPACREIGLSQLYLGEAEVAIEWFMRAELSGPDDPARWTWLQGLGRALLHAGRAGEAVEVLRTLVESHSGWPFSHGLLALALAEAGDDAAAHEHFAEFIRRAPGAGERAPQRLAPVPAERVSAAYRSRDARLASKLAELEAALVWLN